MRTKLYWICLVSALSASSAVKSAEPLPNTKLLTTEGNLSSLMVDGLHKYLDRELAASVEKRQAKWKYDFSSPEAYTKSVQPNRDRLRTILGVVDERVPTRVEFVGSTEEPLVVATAEKYTVYAVRWAVLPDVDAEGLLLRPKAKPIASIVAIPDASWTPEQLVGLAPGVDAKSQFARRLAEQGCTVLVPTLIDRKETFAANAKLNRATNQPHREFVHRMAYEMGRTLLGYEVQKVLAGVDWFTKTAEFTGIPVGVFGYGEGGTIALYAAALDERVASVVVSGSFGPRENIAAEPIYHNIWSLLTEFGDGELLRLVFPRPVVVEWSQFSAAAGPAVKPGRGGAAPGKSESATFRAAYNEVDRGFEAVVPHYKFPRTKSTMYGERNFNLDPDAPDAKVPTAGPGFDNTFNTFLEDLTGKKTKITEPGPEPKDRRVKFDAEARQKRQFDQLVNFTLTLYRNSEATRKAYWSKADAKSPETWEKSCEPYRSYFDTEVMGKLPPASLPPNPRTRQVYDEPTFTGYEVVLDLHKDVWAYGILLLPKDLKPGEKRPVIVCQHGLEGTPRDTITVEKKPVYNHFSRRLVEKGYIVYAPQNPYYGDNVFRQVQRKANPLKLSLFSFIIQQHAVTLDWLEKLPGVDPARIGFYGLSYGGKTAVRVPAVEKRYKFSICSGDFNEWIGKNVRTDLIMTYMYTKEYEMYEFDLGNTFNYAEMAYLIAPRAFMVERGHDDGVGNDEMVSYEFARVRYLYANRLKIPTQTTIEYSVGGHEIFGRGTFAFIEQQVGPGRK